MKPITLDEITPDKLIEIENYAQEVRLRDVTLAKLNELVQEREVAIAALRDIETECQLRALRAYNLGFSKAELSRIFNVTTNQITKWVG